VDQVVELIDVVPTVLELLGLPPHDDAMGRSLVPLLEGTAGDATDERLAYADTVVSGGNWRTVIGRDHQLLVRGGTGKVELYDLRSDPTERVDVAADRPEVVARLREVLEERAAHAARRNTGPAAGSPEIDARTRRQLEALGYLQD
jgi:arylsulfatase A-like enzyme